MLFHDVASNKKRFALDVRDVRVLKFGRRLRAQFFYLFTPKRSPLRTLVAIITKLIIQQRNKLTAMTRNHSQSAEKKTRQKNNKWKL